MTDRIATLAALVEGQIHGDANVQITGAAPLQDAVDGDVTLIDRAENVKSLSGSPASAVLVPRSVTVEGFTTIEVDNVHQAFITLLMHFRPAAAPPATIGVSSEAIIDPSAVLGEQVEVHPGASIGPRTTIGRGTTIHAGARIGADCEIGEDVTIYANAVLYENTRVGPRVIIHGGAVLGAFGFGYRLAEGQHKLTAQLGWVEVEADVEIGACTTIDRGTYGRTLIGAGTKIENQVQIAHNCHIGRHNMLGSQVGIAGSTTTGDYVVMAGQVGVRDHVHIGEKTILGAKAGVVNDIPAGVTYFGIPATPERKQKLLQAALTRLPELRKQVRALRRTIEQLDADDTSRADDAPPRDQAAA